MKKVRQTAVKGKAKPTKKELHPKEKPRNQKRRHKISETTHVDSVLNDVTNQVNEPVDGQSDDHGDDDDGGVTFGPTKSCTNDAMLESDLDLDHMDCQPLVDATPTPSTETIPNGQESPSESTMQAVKDVQDVALGGSTDPAPVADSVTHTGGCHDRFNAMIDETHTMKHSADDVALIESPATEHGHCQVSQTGLGDLMANELVVMVASEESHGQQPQHQQQGAFDVNIGAGGHDGHDVVDTACVGQGHDDGQPLPTFRPLSQERRSQVLSRMFRWPFFVLDVLYRFMTHPERDTAPRSWSKTLTSKIVGAVQLETREYKVFTDPTSTRSQDQHQFYKRLRDQLAGASISSCFSGVDTPATSYMCIGWALTSELGMQLSDLPSARNLFAVEILSCSQWELAHHPHEPEHIFSDIQGFWKPDVAQRIPHLIQSGKIESDLIPLVLSGTSVKDSAFCVKHQRECKAWLLKHQIIVSIYQCCDFVSVFLMFCVFDKGNSIGRTILQCQSQGFLS